MTQRPEIEHRNPQRATLFRRRAGLLQARLRRRPARTCGSHVYLPPQAKSPGKVPVVYYLAGLTCTEENRDDQGRRPALLPREARADAGDARHQPAGRGRRRARTSTGISATGCGLLPRCHAAPSPGRRTTGCTDYVAESELPTLIAAELRRSICRRASASPGIPWAGTARLTIALEEPGDLSARCQRLRADLRAHPVNCPWGQKAFGELSRRSDRASSGRRMTRPSW